MMEKGYGRKYLRIKPDHSMSAELTIVCVAGKPVKSGFAQVGVINISPGGLRFKSALVFPPGDRMLMEFRIKVPDQEYRVTGNIVYGVGMEDGSLEYGVRFTQTDEALKASLKSLFNHMTVRMNRHIVILKF